MKKIFYIVYICVILYVSGLMYLDYCNWAFFVWEENASLVRIEKPITISNYEFIEMLNNFALQTNSVISYELLEDRKEHTSVKFYVMDESEYNQAKKLSILYDISVYDFYEIEQYNLGACSYYVKSAEIGIFYEKLEQNGLYYQILDENVHIKRYIGWNNMIIPVMILLVSFLILVAANRKTFITKRIMGYSIYNIACDFLLSMFLRILIITLIEICFIYAVYRFL